MLHVALHLLLVTMQTCCNTCASHCFNFAGRAGEDLELLLKSWYVFSCKHASTSRYHCKVWSGWQCILSTPKALVKCKTCFKWPHPVALFVPCTMLYHVPCCTMLYHVPCYPCTYRTMLYHVTHVVPCCTMSDTALTAPDSCCACAGYALTLKEIWICGSQTQVLLLWL